MSTTTTKQPVQDQKTNQVEYADDLSSTAPKKVLIHPLVLLSVVDHYNRVARDTDRRVCGVLLGEVKNGIADVSASFAVPFEEDHKNPDTWFFDHDYLETMAAMFRKVNSSEVIIGWYSSGPLIRPNDLAIHEVLRDYIDEPVFCVVDAHRTLGPNNNEVPAKAYCSLPIPPDYTSTQQRDFSHVTLEIGSTEAEDVGVEYLLRGIQSHHGDKSLTELVKNKLAALSGLHNKLHELIEYLHDVAEDRLPYNSKIVDRIQNILSLVPRLEKQSLVNALNEYTNDSLAVVYVSTLIRSVTALHELCQNKALNREAENSKETKQAIIAATRSNENEEVDGEEKNTMDTIGRDSGE